MAYEGGRCLTNTEIADFIFDRMSDEEKDRLHTHIDMAPDFCHECFGKILCFNDEEQSVLEDTDATIVIAAPVPEPSQEPEVAEEATEE